MGRTFLLLLLVESSHSALRREITGQDTHLLGKHHPYQTTATAQLTAANLKSKTDKRMVNAWKHLSKPWKCHVTDRAPCTGVLSTVYIVTYDLV